MGDHRKLGSSWAGHRRTDGAHARNAELVVAQAHVAQRGALCGGPHSRIKVRSLEPLIADETR